MNKKYLLIPIIIGLLGIGYVLSQEESYISPPIQPTESDSIRVCYKFKMKTIKEEIEKEYCRDYPMDLLNHCKYDRYGKPINCENIFRQELDLDIEKWYKVRLPQEIDEEVTIEDFEVKSVSHPDYKHLESCKYDFMSDDIVC